MAYVVCVRFGLLSGIWSTGVSQQLGFCKPLSLLKIKLFTMQSSLTISILLCDLPSWNCIILTWIHHLLESKYSCFTRKPWLLMYHPHWEKTSQKSLSPYNRESTLVHMPSNEHFHCIKWIKHSQVTTAVEEFSQHTSKHAIGIASIYQLYFGFLPSYL